MATIAGILHLQSGDPAVNVGMRFILMSAPFADSGLVATGRPILTETDNAGAYSQSLTAGIYEVDIPATPPFQITVPAGNGTFRLEDILTEPGDGGGGGPELPAVGSIPVFIATITEARGLTFEVTTIEVDLGIDDNGDPGTFQRDQAFSTSGRTDGVDYFRDASGAIFKRLRFL